MEEQGRQGALLSEEIIEILGVRVPQVPRIPAAKMPKAKRKETIALLGALPGVALVEAELGAKLAPDARVYFARFAAGKEPEVNGQWVRWNDSLTGLAPKNAALLAWVDARTTCSRRRSRRCSRTPSRLAPTAGTRISSRGQRRAFGDFFSPIRIGELEFLASPFSPRSTPEYARSRLAGVRRRRGHTRRRRGAAENRSAENRLIRGA